MEQVEQSEESPAVSQQHVLMQQLVAASTQGDTQALASILQAQQQGYALLHGQVPLSFVQHAEQQAAPQVPASPAHQNSLHGGSPAPPTPSSHSLGSPPPQMEQPGTPRSTTPASTPSQLELQLHMQAQLQSVHKAQALQQQAQQQAQQTREQQALLAQAQKEELQKTLKPPKKPLTPYMRFSKSVWPKVKEQNAGLSVCEIGASIGKMWRELPDDEKTRYNDDFTADKVRYDEDLQKYLKLTGLQASDLVKPRSRKKKAAQHAVTAPPPHEPHNKAPAPQPQQLPMHLFPPGQQISPNQAMLFQGQLAAAAQIQGQAGQAQVPNGPAAVSYQQGVNGGVVLADNLPGFTQVWQQAEGEQAAPQDSQQQQVASINAYLSMLQQAHLQAQQQAQQQAAAQQEEPPAASPHPPAVTSAEQPAGWQWHQPNSAAAERPEPPPAPQAEQTEAGGEPRDEDKRNGPSTDAAALGGSAHSLYNSYAYNPWSAYPAHGQFGGGGGQGKPIETKEAIAGKELEHLKGALGEKTREVERLTGELEKALTAIEHLKNQNVALNNSLALITTQAHQAHHGNGTAHEAAQQDAAAGGTG